MEEKTDAVVLRSVDYRDNDKILTLLSADKGKITVGIKGVRRNGAKLRFASEPFVFAEYVYVSKGGRNTVTGAYLHDEFFELRTDVEKYYCACALSEVVTGILPEGVSDARYFLSVLKSLKDICYGDERVALANLLFESVSFSGFLPDLTGCGNCGAELSGELFFDFSTGRFFCPECSRGVKVSAKTFSILKDINVGRQIEIGRDDDSPIRAVRLLNRYLSHRTELNFPALDEYIKMTK